MVIYKTINLINGKCYVGKDSKNDPTYIGSGHLIRAAIKKYGRDNFHKEILEECTTLDELNSRESFWIMELNTFAPIGYNIASGGSGGDTRRAFTPDQYEEWLRHKSDAQKGKRSYWKEKTRPSHATKLKDAHARGVFGDYGWIKGRPKGCVQKKANCLICGKTIAICTMKRHLNGKNCKRG